MAKYRQGQFSRRKQRGIRGVLEEDPLKIKYVLEYETSEIPMNPDWIKKKIENVTNTINNHFKRNKMKGHRIYMRKVYDQT